MSLLYRARAKVGAMRAVGAQYDDEGKYRFYLLIGHNSSFTN